MQKWRRGSITIFIVIVLAIMIPLTGVLIDLARLSEATKIAKSSIKVCAESMLAAYDRQLKEQYSLFAMYPRDVAAMEKEIYALLTDNLVPDDVNGTVTNLYGFSVQKVEVIPFYNLSEPYVLEQQVTEFMKYRAPVQTVTEFIEKVKALVGLVKEADMVSKNMDIDKKLNEFRADIVHYALLLEKKMISINYSQGTQLVGDAAKAALRDDSKKITEGLNEAQKSIDPANKAREVFREAKQSYDDASFAYNQAEQAASNTQDKIDELNRKISAIDAELSDNKLTAAEIDAKQRAKADAEAEVSVLSDILTSEQANAQAKKQAADSAKNTLDQAAKDLSDALQKLLDAYKTIQASTDNIRGKLLSLKNHLYLHLEYNTMAIGLAEDILKKVEALQNDMDNLQKEVTSNQNSGVGSQISADLSKKVQSLDKQHFKDMIARLGTNKDLLAYWIQAIDTAYQKFGQALDPLNRDIQTITNMMANPGNGDTVIYGLTSYNEFVNHKTTVDNALANLESYDTMKNKGVYAVPDFTLSPEVIESEVKEFGTWYYNTFSKVDPQATSPSASGETAENPELQKTRDSMKGSAGEIAAEKPDDVENRTLQEIYSDSKITWSLPSKGASVSSEDALDQILDQTIDTAINQIGMTLDAEAQGLDTVHESQKSFFDYEMERMRELIKKIGELVANGLESMMKSLYMNEYIVSAFKNATHGKLEREYDIGWDRPLETTAFKKGEVEYIIFGKMNEAENIAASQRSIFAIRLIFNLLHIYSDPEKIATTLKIATAIAGWTIFGVPLVQNFLMVCWAGLESYVDSEMLMEGKSVPLIKTKQSWFLDPKKLQDYLLNTVLKELKTAAIGKANEVIDDAASYLEETVTTFINGKLDELFAPIEQGFGQAVSYVTEEIDSSLFKDEDMSFTTAKEIKDLESFLDYLKGELQAKFNGMMKALEHKGTQYILEYKQAIKKYICDLIFKSDIYIKLKNEVKRLATELIDKGINAVSDKLNSVLGTKSGGLGSGGSNVLGRLVMMDYTDYLRLMLLAVSPQDKALRTGDLIQMNMRTTMLEREVALHELNTGLYVKAYIDIDFWFIPESLAKGNKDGMIVVEWSLGY